MTAALYIFAGLISAIGCYLHIVRGGRLIVQPMMQAELHHVPKHTLKFSWDWGAVTMVMLTVCYLAPLFGGGGTILAMMASVYGYALGVLSFRTMWREKFRVAQMPQWILFWLASGASLIAWGVL